MVVLSRVQSLQVILQGIQASSGGRLIRSNFERNGCHCALGCLGASLGIPVSVYVDSDEPGTMDEILSEEFEHVISQLDPHIVWELEMLADFHTVGMKRQERYHFITNAMMDAIQNNGNWQLTSSFHTVCAETECPCKITITV